MVITTATCISSFNNVYLANKISQLNETANSVEFAGIVTKISSYLKMFSSSILELLKTPGLGTITAFLIGFVIVSILMLITIMFIFGYLKVGFIVGIKIISLFKWEPVARYQY